MGELMHTKPKILIVRGGALGDVIMTTPIVREIFNDYDGFCEIYVQTGFPDVFKNNPYVAGVNPTTHQHYDAIYNLMLSYENNPQMHSVAAYGWSVFGNIQLSNYSLELFETNIDSQVVLDKHYDNYVVIHMRQHDWPAKNLRPEFYKDVIDRILNNTSLNIIQVGGSHELAFTGNERLINDLGKYSIQEMKCLISNAKAFIGMDSGLMHVAACTPAPIIALFSICKEEVRRPLRKDAKFYPIKANIDCYGCLEHLPIPTTTFYCRKETTPCVDAFNADEIMNALLDAIK